MKGMDKLNILFRCSLLGFACLFLHGTTCAQVASAESTVIPERILNEKFQSLRGRTFRLANYKNTVVVLALWTTWCVPCRAAMVDLNKIDRKYRSTDKVKVAALTVEDTDDAEQLCDYVRTYKLGYELIWGEKEIVELLFQAKDFIPKFFIFSSDGHIQERLKGFNPKTTPILLRKAIEKALGK
jgi:thiol-disulfide isomerase/thioredoxin